MSNNDRIENLEVKLDKLSDGLSAIDKTLERNTSSLEMHMKRTDMLEQYVKEELTPLKTHMTKITYGIKGIMWFCGIIVTVAGFIVSLQKLGVI